MKVAHISDLHLNTLFTDSNLRKIKKLLSYISLQDPDHLVITGDLTDNADISDLIILKKLLYKYGFLRGEKCSIIPGNHDIFGGIQIAEDLFTFPDRCKKTDYKARIDSFNKIILDTFDNCIYISEKSFYPYAKLIKNNLLIGLNSIAEYSRFKNPFASNGEISLSQFNELTGILTNYQNEVDRIIILIHHHFHKLKSNSTSIAGLWQNIEKQTMKLKNKKRLFNLFNQFKVDIVLHGHIHRCDEYIRKGIRFLNCGGSVKGISDKSGVVNFIYLDKDRIDTEIHKIDKEGNVKIQRFEAKKFYENITGLTMETNEPVASAT